MRPYEYVRKYDPFARCYRVHAGWIVTYQDHKTGEKLTAPAALFRPWAWRHAAEKIRHERQFMML